jgi:mannosyltransferase OCH1-like enzyme
LEKLWQVSLSIIFPSETKNCSTVLGTCGRFLFTSMQRTKTADYYGHRSFLPDDAAELLPVVRIIHLPEGLQARTYRRTASLAFFLLLLALPIIQVHHHMNTLHPLLSTTIWIQHPAVTSRLSPTFIPLQELVNTHKETSCPNGLHLMQDKFLDPKLVYNNNRLIPKVIHVTAKSRCVTEPFRSNLETNWRSYPDHAFVFYNDQAVDRILNKDYPEFPHMQQVLQCLKGGAAKADLFRAVILWEYGGIYTDFDNGINHFNASTTIASNDEAFFVIEGARILSQFFFAARPKHPLMFLLIQQILLRSLMLNSVDHAYVPFVTGPGALKTAFVHYMNSQGPNEPRNSKINHYSRYRNLSEEGVYHGIGNSSVTVKGDPLHSSFYIRRTGIKHKNQNYAKMNMTHFSDKGEKTNNTDSCMNRIHHNLQRQLIAKQPNFNWGTMSS